MIIPDTDMDTDTSVDVVQDVMKPTSAADTTCLLLYTRRTETQRCGAGCDAAASPADTTQDTDTRCDRGREHLLHRQSTGKLKIYHR